jgi:hypothetical protein
MVTKLHYNLPICYLIGILYSRVKYHKFQSYQNSLWLRTINFLLIKMFQCPTRSIQIETINHRREDLIFLVCFCFAFLLLFYLFVQTNGLSVLCFPIRLVYAFKEMEREHKSGNYKRFRFVFYVGWCAQHFWVYAFGIRITVKGSDKICQKIFFLINLRVQPQRRNIMCSLCRGFKQKWFVDSTHLPIWVEFNVQRQMKEKSFCQSWKKIVVVH